MRKSLLIFLLLTFAFVTSGPRLRIAPTKKASKLKIEDVGGYYDGRDNVEDALASIATGDVVDTIRKDLTIFGDTYVQGDFGVSGTATADIINATQGATADVVHATSDIVVGTTPFGVLRKDASDNLTFWDSVTGEKTLAELSAGAAGGDTWSDAVDADILPTGNDNTYDLGSTAASFKDGYFQGTLEAGTLTEGGNAVSNDTEIEAVVEPLIDTLANLTSVQSLTIGLADAGADAFYGWDDTAVTYENLTAAEALTIIGGAANDFDGSGDVTIAAADISDQHANTDITADLEEEVTAGSLADDTINNDDVNWDDIDNLGDEGTITVADTTDTTSYMAIWESATGDLAAKTDAGAQYNAGTGSLTLTGTATADIVDTSRLEYSSGQLTFNDTTTGVKTLAELAAGGGASTALDNLASVAINTSLLSDTDNTDDLGSTAKSWKDAYIEGTATADIVDVQFLERGGGTTVTVRDNLTVNGNITANNLIFEKAAVYENLVAADDNVSLGAFAKAVTITGVGCAYVGTGTTVATITLEDGSGNAMTITGTNPVCQPHGTDFTFAAVTANNTLNAGEIVRMDVTNTPDPTTDDYTVVLKYTIQ